MYKAGVPNKLAAQCINKNTTTDFSPPGVEYFPPFAQLCYLTQNVIQVCVLVTGLLQSILHLQMTDILQMHSASPAILLQVQEAP